MVVIPSQAALFCLVVLIPLHAAVPARAEVLFEGYSKVMLGGAHTGFVVQRYEFDSKKQEFTVTYYLKTTTTGGNVTESLKAKATAGLTPISYQYTELVGDKAKTIDATVKGDMMTAVVKDGARAQTLQKKIPKGAFFSSFLVYLMLQGKEGVKPGVKYSYMAIAEEDAGVYPGEAAVKSKETHNAIDGFKILNTFKNVQFISWVTHKGEVLGTRSPVQDISTELVANVQEATKGLSFNTNTVSVLFGGVPAGKENPVTRKQPSPEAPAPATLTAQPAAPAPAANAAPAKPLTDEEKAAAQEKKRKILESQPSLPPEDTPKKQGVPGGQGMILKGGETKPKGP